MTVPAPTAVEVDVTVATVAGELHGVVTAFEGVGSAPGLVMVDGSGDGDRHGWGERPEWLAAAGAVVLRHDKPGCGGSPGHWTQQTLEDRARETLAAVAVLRRRLGGTSRPVGLYGVSQGGWVALLAAASEPAQVDFVICQSSPGTTPVAQERERLRAWLAAEGTTPDELSDALSWVDERAERILRGESAETILRDQAELAERRWYETVRVPYDTPANIAFLRGMLGFEPATVLPRVVCPVLAMFGGADDMVPVADSVAAYVRHLPASEEHGLVVFPRADHRLLVTDETTRDELPAAGYRALVADFLERRRRS